MLVHVKAAHCSEVTEAMRSKLKQLNNAKSQRLLKSMIAQHSLLKLLLAHTIIRNKMH